MKETSEVVWESTQEFSEIGLLVKCNSKLTILNHSFVACRNVPPKKKKTTLDISSNTYSIHQLLLMYTFVPFRQVRQVQYNFARSEDINEGALTVFSAENFMGAAFLCFE